MDNFYLQKNHFHQIICWYVELLTDYSGLDLWL